MSTEADFSSEQKRWRQLTQILLSGPNDEACQQCLNQLDDYIMSQLAEEDYLTKFSEVAIHLDTCLVCAAAYNRLYELETAVATNTLPQPKHLPKPDLSFLIPLVQQLKEALQRHGNRLSLQLTTMLVEMLRPSTPATVMRSSEGQYQEQLISLTPQNATDLDLTFTLTVYRDKQVPNTCLLEVKVEPPGQSWPALGGKEVTIMYNNAKQTEVTDAWGIASFTGIPVDALGQLYLEITE